jgi:hypothetical protein
MWNTALLEDVGPLIHSRSKPNGKTERHVLRGQRKRGRDTLSFTFVAGQKTGNGASALMQVRPGSASPYVFKGSACLRTYSSTAGDVPARQSGTLRLIRRRISARVPVCEPGSALRSSRGRPSSRRFSGAAGALKTRLRPRIRAISSIESNASGGGDRRGPRRPTRLAGIIPDRIGFQPAGRSSSREGTPSPAPLGSGRRSSSRGGRNVRNRYLGVG